MTDQPRGSVLPVALLVVLGTSWGLRVSLIKLAAQSGIPHPTIALITTVGVATLLLSITLLTRRRFPVRRKYLKYFTICAILGYVAPFFLQLYAAERVPAGTLSLIFSLLPIAALVVALITKTDRATKAGMASIGLGVASVGILLGPEVMASGFGAVDGALAALCVPVIFGIDYNYIARRWPPELDSVQVATGEVLVAIPLMLPLYIWFGAAPDLSTSWGPGEWAILIMIAFWALDTYLYFEIVRLAGPIFTSQGNYIMLLSGVVWGAILFDERPTTRFWLSLAMVIPALGLLTWQRVTEARRPGPGASTEDRRRPSPPLTRTP